MPLDGIRVLDFSRHLAGPYAANILGDFGGDVIKVEGTPGGDPARGLRTGKEQGDRDSRAFTVYNHGKRSLAVDLRSPAGLQLVQRLARSIDVVIENFRPGIADTIGIGYEHLRTDNPGLVYCSVSAFGYEGPWAGVPATDPVVQAMSGLIHLTGHANDPVRVGVPIADVMGAMASVQGILLALHSRHATGLGQWVDVSLLHTMALSHTTRLAELLSNGAEPGGQGTAHSLVAPYQVFDTADGKVVAGSWTEDTWPRFCRALGVPDLESDPRFTTNVDRVANREALAKIINDVMKQRTRAEWEGRFHDAGALYGPVLTISEANHHPQMSGRPANVEIDHPDWGSVTVPNPPAAIRLHATPGQVRRPPPLLGEHTVEVLTEFGFSSTEIDELVASGVIHQDRQ